MIVSEIKLFELLRAKIGVQEAEAFVQLLEIKVDKKFEEAKDTLATKNDIFLVKEDMAKQEARLTRTIFMSGLIQYLAILASLVAVMKLFMR